MLGGFRGLSLAITQSAIIRSIAPAGGAAVFDTSGMDEVSFSAVQLNGTVGSLVLTVQVEIAPGVWSAVPSGAVTVATAGTATDGIPVTTPRVRVVVTTAGTSGAFEVYMHGRTSV